MRPSSRKGVPAEARDLDAEHPWRPAFNQHVLKASPRSSICVPSGRFDSPGFSPQSSPFQASAPSGGTFVPGWNWGAPTTPKATPSPPDARASQQHHVRVQSSNFNGDSPAGSLGQGLIGLRRSSLAEKVFTAQEESYPPQDVNVELEPDSLREYAIARYGLHLRPPPGMDKLDMLFQTLTLTNPCWSYVLYVASKEGLTHVAGDKWHKRSPCTPCESF